MRRLPILFLAPVVSLASAALLAACGDDGSAATSSEPWGRTFLADGPPPLRVVFSDDQRVSAVAECNHIAGSASIEDGALRVDEWSITEMGCDPERHAYDEWLLGFLTSSPAVALDGDTLTLSSGSDTLVLTDREVADPDRPLEQTRWLVDGLVSGDAVSSVPAGADDAFVVFSPGRVEGSTGCNSFGADTTIDGDEIEVGPMTSTKVACDGAAMAVEDAIFATLTGTVRYEITGAQLTLSGPDGNGVLLRAE
jgi:heat shock protein HslJ